MILEKFPPFSEIDSALKNSVKAADFLSSKSRVKALSDCWKSISEKLYLSDITPANKGEFVEAIHEAIARLLQIFTKDPIAKLLPVAYKKKLNVLVFNAVTSKPHFNLLLAYHKSMEKENAAARTRMIRSNYSDSKMYPAVERLKNILHSETPLDAIDKLSNFYNDVVAALPGVEIAADDILPAICMAMGKDSNLSTHIVSFFAYLCDIWPEDGLDESTSYILTTCSIAATHLSMEEPVQEKASSKNSIQLLEGILDLL